MTQSVYSPSHSMPTIQFQLRPCPTAAREKSQSYHITVNTCWCKVTWRQSVMLLLNENTETSPLRPPWPWDEGRLWWLPGSCLLLAFVICRNGCYLCLNTVYKSVSIEVIFMLAHQTRASIMWFMVSVRVGSLSLSS